MEHFPKILAFKKYAKPKKINSDRKNTDNVVDRHKDVEHRHRSLVHAQPSYQEGG